MAIKTVQVTINGVPTTLTLNSSTGKYEATITAPAKSSYNQSGGYYNVTVKATDTAGNSTSKDATDATLGSKLKLVVKEKVAPTITVTYPTASATTTNNKPTFKWKVTDDDSGVDSNTIGITIDSGSKITSGITKTATTGGYECSYTSATALSDGSHTVKFNASDNDGNAATQKSVTFKVDTVPPTLNVTSPAEGLVTNNATVTVKVNETAVTVDASGNFSTTVTLTEGSNTITVVATDSAGKATTVTRKVTLDTKAPTITDVSITPNPVDGGKTFVIAVSVTD
mgnify:CR=1 FL=1